LLPSGSPQGLEVIISLVIFMDRNQTAGRTKRSAAVGFPAAVRWFLETIADRPVVLGRKTRDSLPGSLPGRLNVVLTRNRGYEAKGCLMLHSVEGVLEVLAGYEEVMVIGGGNTLRQFFPYASRVHLAVVGHRFTDDFYSPPRYWSKNWRIGDRKEIRRGNGVPSDLTFLVLERINLAPS